MITLPYYTLRESNVGQAVYQPSVRQTWTGYRTRAKWLTVGPRDVGRKLYKTGGVWKIEERKAS